MKTEYVIETVAVATLNFEFEIVILLVSCEVRCSVSFESHYVSGNKRHAH